jgi:hypothetical protein
VCVCGGGGGEGEGEGGGEGGDDANLEPGLEPDPGCEGPMSQLNSCLWGKGSGWIQFNTNKLQ